MEDKLKFALETMYILEGHYIGRLLFDKLDNESKNYLELVQEAIREISR